MGSGRSPRRSPMSTLTKVVPEVSEPVAEPSNFSGRCLTSALAPGLRLRAHGHVQRSLCIARRIPLCYLNLFIDKPPIAFASCWQARS